MVWAISDTKGGLHARLPALGHSSVKDLALGRMVECVRGGAFYGGCAARGHVGACRGCIFFLFISLPSRPLLYIIMSSLPDPNLCPKAAQMPAPVWVTLPLSM